MNGRMDRRIWNVSSQFITFGSLFQFQLWVRLAPKLRSQLLMSDFARLIARVCGCSRVHFSVNDEIHFRKGGIRKALISTAIDVLFCSVGCWFSHIIMKSKADSSLVPSLSHTTCRELVAVKALFFECSYCKYQCQWICSTIYICICIHTHIYIYYVYILCIYIMYIHIIYIHIIYIHT